MSFGTLLQENAKGTEARGGTAEDAEHAEGGTINRKELKDHKAQIAAEGRKRRKKKSQ